jgi:hypothetical protein
MDELNKIEPTPIKSRSKRLSKNITNQSKSSKKEKLSKLKKNTKSCEINLK